MDGTPVSLTPGVLMPETSVQLTPGDLIHVEGSVPNSATVPILSETSAIQTASGSSQDMNVFTLSQAGASIVDNQATVLHIDADQLKALQDSGDVRVGDQLLLIDDSKTVMKQQYMEQEGPLLLVNNQLEAPPLEQQIVEGEGLGMIEAGSLMKEDGKTAHDMAEDMQGIAEEIKQKIKDLCGELSDMGEESFLVTVRIRDGTSGHLGSVKGDHFCLLRQELLEDFHDFCLGIEEAEDDNKKDNATSQQGPVELVDTDQHLDTTEELNQDQQHNGDDEPQHEDSMETEEALSHTEEPPLSPPPLEQSISPKVIVMKKDSSNGKVRVDHQYTISSSNKKVTVTTPASKKVPQPKIKPEVIKLEPEEAANILFLCDICKDVFVDLKQLKVYNKTSLLKFLDLMGLFTLSRCVRKGWITCLIWSFLTHPSDEDTKDHKISVHGEGEHRCTECSRVFTLMKNLERHKQDAHTGDSETERFLCDSCLTDFLSKDDLQNHIQSCHNPEFGMKCDVCEQTFTDMAKLMEHRKLHFDYSCFCPHCWQGFFDFLELETHIQSNCQYKEALYKCSVCAKKYTKLHGINKHIDTHPIHAPFVCRMCGRGFDEEKDLRNHRVAAHIIRPYKCEICDKLFKKRESLVEHRRVHLRSKLTPVSSSTISVSNGGEDLEEGHMGFECGTCGIVLETQSLYDQHMLGHTEGSEEHHCDHCDKIFFSRSLLVVHNRKEHKIFLNSKLGDPNNDNLLACEWEGCSKTFDDHVKFKYHMKYHQNRADKIARGIPVTPQAEACECPLCGKTLKYKSYLKLHMANHSGESKHQCDICGTSYPTAKKLSDHIRVHKGEKPFKCRLCDKYFTSTTLRQQHMVVHWGSKTYICDICGKGFMSRKHFQDHMRIHNGEQPHKCETCGKDFIYFRSLVRHALTHIDPKERPKPYKCQYCGKDYTEVTGYKHHLRSVHTGETPYQCELCGEAFHRNDKLKRHMRARHNRLVSRDGQNVMTHIVTTRRDGQHGTPVIIKHEQAPIEGQEELQQGELQIIQGEGGDGASSELHVDVIQETSPQVFLIGLGSEGGETTYLQETQVIEGPDGTRYIIAGSGEELQVFETPDIQEGDVIQNGGETITVLEQTDQETLTTLANMASVAEIADVVQ